MEKKAQNSGHEPKIFVTKIIGGKVFKSVVEKDGPGDSLLKASGYSILADGEDLGRVRSRITIQCPVCGCSKERFEETGRFGCPECYKTFGPFLSPILRKLHTGLTHIGKIPRRKISPEIVRERIRFLEEDLKRAIKKEDFENAARLRDQISSLDTLLAARQ